MRTSTRRAFGVAAALTAVALAGSAVAVAGPGKKHKRLVRGAVHADVSLIHSDGTADSFTFDRGRVTARRRARSRSCGGTARA